MLDTVANYVTQARTLLQDTVSPYRYSDIELVAALSLAILAARGKRPDLFLRYFDTALPYFTANDATAVDIDPMYRLAFLYFIVGHAQLRDAEDTTDARAGAFLAKFVAQLLSVNS